MVVIVGVGLGAVGGGEVLELRWGDNVWTHWLCGLSVTQRGGCPLLEELVLYALVKEGLAGIAHWPWCL